VGLGVQRFMGAFGWVRRHYAWIAGVSGALLIVVGVLLATGEFTRIIAPLSRYGPGL
jgi:cytochrome c-type biogenesis protein